MKKKTKKWFKLFTSLSLIAALSSCFYFQNQSVVQDNSREMILKTPTGEISGSLELPAGQGPHPVVLLIAGSGPTDRNGNQPFLTTNIFYYLANALRKEGIASLRFDKRAVKKSKAAGPRENDLRFEHYIQDVEGWIKLLKADARFSKVFVAGHSEGSLIGMVAIQRESVDGYLSIAGAGQSGADILQKQLSEGAPELAKKALPILKQLSQGQKVKKIPLMLKPVFRASVQDYMISWFKYDPSVEIAKLTIPTLILQGSTDIQVKLEDAKALKAALPSAQLTIIEGMNHILKDSPLERKANLKTYNQPNLPLNKELLPVMIQFIKAVDSASPAVVKVGEKTD